MNHRRSKKRPAGPPPVIVPSTSESEASESSGSFLPTREAVESILVAILLALLFRGFEAEAFIIPTGSMAPTLQGRHKDLVCPQCAYQYRVGDAVGQGRLGMDRTACPMCHYILQIDPTNRNQVSFNGDRILVNKFIYEFVDPKRWDVIVFKFPGNAKQNYIKRLVGLPGESLKIRSGDVFVQGPEDSEFQIARKPPEKLSHLLHLIHDTRYTPKALADAGWPARWQEVDGDRWQISNDQQMYQLAATDDAAWLRYRHLPPDLENWRRIQAGRKPDLRGRVGELITDFYAYNENGNTGLESLMGWHWVGDLAMDVTAEIESDDGELSLDLVEGGHHLTCRIDVATGQATIEIDAGQGRFDSSSASARPDRLTAMTPIRGAGTYRIKWSNVDDQVLLWVNRQLIPFTSDGEPHAGHYAFDEVPTPAWSPSDPGDLLPLAVGGKGLDVTLRNLRVYRDVYYVAAANFSDGAPTSDYPHPSRIQETFTLFRSPDRWSTTNLFSERGEIRFDLEADQFFPMGDNSPSSRDARIWSGPAPSFAGDDGGFINVPPFVERRLLIGKAFLVYWPHGWYPGVIPFPILPNLDRMGRIH